MARRKRKKSERRFVYFYLNNELHKVLYSSRADDTLIAWNFTLNKRVAYNLTEVQKNRRHAYSISEVSKIIGRHPDTIKRHLRSGELRKPQRSYSLEDNSRKGRYYFSDDDIREMHDFFRTVHIGRPRNDGRIVASNIPSRTELEALLRNEKVLYAKREDGTFVPVWKQPEW